MYKDIPLKEQEHLRGLTFGGYGSSKVPQPKVDEPKVSILSKKWIKEIAA